MNVVSILWLDYEAEANVIYDLQRCQGWEGTKIECRPSQLILRCNSVYVSAHIFCSADSSHFMHASGAELSMIGETVSKLNKFGHASQNP